MNIRVSLLDSGFIDIPQKTTVLELAKKLFPKKQELTAGAFINHSKTLSDLRTTLNNNDHIQIVFIPSNQSLEVIRHSASHVMAQAVQELWPNVKVTIGPVIESGFYYDFDSPHTFTLEDLKTIETKMKQIIKRKSKIVKHVWSQQKAINVFQQLKEDYKVEIIKELGENEVSIYQQEQWFDLCKGPHVENLSQIGAIKVLHNSGSYWRGNKNNKQLQRIYATAFHTEKDLKKHLHNLEEAAKRDHRKLGKEMDLFYFSDLSSGNPFFTSKGTIIYNELKQFLRTLYNQYNYEEVITPQLFNSQLFTQSGHKQHFAENMYSLDSKPTENTLNNNTKQLFLKPMNCPGHCVLYSFKKLSYKNLPWRVADFGRLHRKENKGVLHGLTRVNSMCQDDAHIFCTPQQLEQEIQNVLNMFQKVYRLLGLTKYKIALSTRPVKSMGEDAIWDKSEKILASVLKKSQIPYEIYPGEGAFYGPKLDLMCVDAMNSSWQLGTLQCDFNMPKSFNLKYTSKNNTEETPILLHRAILGSLERFIGVYLEHTAGILPLWLAPVQVLLINISQTQEDYIQQCAKQMRDLGLRVQTDLRSEKLGYKIREARFKRIPYMAIAGSKEQESASLSIRLREGQNTVLNKDIFIKTILNNIQKKMLNISLNSEE